MRPIEHGTPARYRAELRLDGKTCEACRAAHAAAGKAWRDEHPRVRPSTGRPVGRPPSRRDEVMAEWYLLRGTVGFVEFARRAGMRRSTWERMFERACDLGDWRAVRYDRIAEGRAAA